MATKHRGVASLHTTEDALAFISNILESSTEYSIIGIDLERNILLWNEGARRLYGYEAAEVVGSAHSSILFAPVEVEAGKPLRITQEALKHGKWEGRVLRVRKNGQQFTAKVVVTPRRNSGGEPIGFLIMSSDISEEVRLKEEIRAAGVKFTALLEAAPDAIVIVNSEGAITVVNARAEGLFGYCRKEMLNRPAEMLVPERYWSEHRGHRSTFFSKQGVRSLGGAAELYGLGKDGNEFPVEISLSPLETEQGTQVLSAIRDITERKRSERTLLEKNIELENAVLSKDRFLASMSHELRTPMNAIMGFTGTLLMKLAGPLTSEQERQLRTIQTSSRHLLSLINDLLDLAKIGSGKVEVNLEEVSAKSVVEEVVTALGPSAQGKGLNLVVTVPDSDVQVHTDCRALRQILLNLTSNAIKFTEAGSVRVELSRESSNGDSVTRFTVTDTGVGILPEDQQHLFQAFSRVGMVRSSRPEGTGLGLHLSQKLAALLGGHIVFKSEFGKGSEFSLVLGTKRHAVQGDRNI